MIKARFPGIKKKKNYFTKLKIVIQRMKNVKMHFSYSKITHFEATIKSIK